MMLVKAGVQLAKKLHSNLEALQRNFGGVPLITLFSGSEVQERLAWPEALMFSWPNIIGCNGKQQACFRHRQRHSCARWLCSWRPFILRCQLPFEASERM